MMMLLLMLLSAFCRIAIYVEEIYSESAKRLQLSTDEEIKSETFPSSSIVFSEIKVDRNSVDLKHSIINCTSQAMSHYLQQNGVKYSLSSTNQGLL